MRETIDKIRTLLDELGQEAEGNVTMAERALVSGLELPDIIRDVVDLLLPELKPYEAALYMYMLRHSVVETGSQMIRVSRRGLQSGIVKSAYAGTGKGWMKLDSVATSYKTVRTALDGLEVVAAIRREAEANRSFPL